MSIRRKIELATVFFGGAVLVLLATASCLPVVLNTTPSLPRGLYLKTDEIVERGKIVLFCPDPLVDAFQLARKRGYISYGTCQGNYQHMIKRVVAVEGDSYSIEATGLRVNEQLLPGSVPFAVDSRGKPLPVLRERGRIPAGRLLLYSEYDPRSYDSRYFGTVAESQVESVLQPLLTQ